jgi:redox-sensitive bicupin YhaK (pirin superfamily)
MRMASATGSPASFPGNPGDLGVVVGLSISGFLIGDSVKWGPVAGIATDPIYLDVSVPPGKRKSLPVETTRHAFAYVFAGSGKFCNASGPLAVPTESYGWGEVKPPVEADNRSLVLFDSGDEVSVQAGEDGIRFLLISGKPLQEPVAWYGPIVMNTQAQLRQAFEELDRGTFLKTGTKK